jgi:hypothetical protein
MIQMVMPRIVIGKFSYDPEKKLPGTILAFPVK